MEYIFEIITIALIITLCLIAYNLIHRINRVEKHIVFLAKEMNTHHNRINQVVEETRAILQDNNYLANKIQQLNINAYKAKKDKIIKTNN